MYRHLQAVTPWNWYSAFCFLLIPCECVAKMQKHASVSCELFCKSVSLQKTAQKLVKILCYADLQKKQRVLVQKQQQFGSGSAIRELTCEFPLPGQWEFTVKMEFNDDKPIRMCWARMLLTDIMYILYMWFTAMGKESLLLHPGKLT